MITFAYWFVGLSLFLQNGIQVKNSLVIPNMLKSNNDTNN